MELVKDRVVLIVGATDEVGEAISMRLAKAGAKILIADDDQSKIQGLVTKIKDLGGEAIGLEGDPKKADDVKKAVETAVDKFGEIHVLVNNVDDPMSKGISELTYDDWNQSLQNNLNPLFLFCRDVITRMREQKYGRIINSGSIDYLGRKGKSNYSAVKSAIFGFTRSLALEVGKECITVNAVIKGDVSDSNLSEEESEKLANSIPVKKLGTPEDVAYAVAYFASDTSKYVTGQTLFVCGGKSIHSSMSI